MKYVVYLKGDHVWNGVALEFIINDTKDSTLEQVSNLIEDRYHILVYEFIRNWAFLRAETSDDKIVVIIEEIEEL